MSFEDLSGTLCDPSSSTLPPVAARQCLSCRSTGSCSGGVGRPDASTARGIDPVVRVPARKDVTSELFGGQHRVTWIMRHLATAVADPTDHPHERSCTLSLRIIPPLPKSGKMLPYHTIMRERCRDSAPCVLPACDFGMPMALRYAALWLAEPIHRVPPKVSSTSPPAVQAQTLHRAQSLRGSDAKTPLCRL
jgi:hypothetical protein